VGFGINIRIDTDGDWGLFADRVGNGFYSVLFGGGFYIETTHAYFECTFDFYCRFCSPLYVYSRTDNENNSREFDRAFGTHPHLVCYTVTANSNLAVLNILAKIGAGFDIVSIGELERVLAAGGTADKCVFSGVAKTTIQIKRALEDFEIILFWVELPHMEFTDPVYIVLGH
jgi:hypothetical protein